MDSSSLLAGLKIVVTRPRDQAAQLARSIEQAGGVPLLFPLLEIAAAQDSEALHEQISRLDQFDLAIFISPNAVRYGMEVICATLSPSLASTGGANVGRASARHVGLKPDLRIAAVGQGSAKALRELGITNIIAPTERFDSEALLALPELHNVQGWRVMIFRGNGGRELLGDTLKARGAVVEYATCYQRSKTQQNPAELLNANADALTVTSSEALAYLWEMLEAGGRARLAALPLFVPHERIAAAAHKQGWQNVIVTASGDEGLLAGLIVWARSRNA